MRVRVWLARKWDRWRSLDSSARSWLSRIKATTNYGRGKRWLWDLSVAVFADTIAALILYLSFRGR
ncbi:hypothetical protein ACIBL6_08950 [Streptomyces sp. NPDC050400]|uniref:hypothetical protein n=1 Tax=Streptomyces sp. NPDC050400 TaxID=3365610 RepID=UPI0037BBED5E